MIEVCEEKKKVIIFQSNFWSAKSFQFIAFHLYASRRQNMLFSLLRWNAFGKRTHVQINWRRDISVIKSQRAHSFIYFFASFVCPSRWAVLYVCSNCRGNNKSTTSVASVDNATEKWQAAVDDDDKSANVADEMKRRSEKLIIIKCWARDFFLLLLSMIFLFGTFAVQGRFECEK